MHKLFSAKHTFWLMALGAFGMSLASCGGGGGGSSSPAATTFNPVFYSFSGSTNSTPSTDGADASLPVQAADGNFYGVTQSGGFGGVGTFYKLALDGTETVLYSFGASAYDARKPFGLAVGDDGNFYGFADGGLNGAGAIYRITPAGVETVLNSFPSGITSKPDWRLTKAGDGTFYGTMPGGGVSGKGSVFSLKTDGTLVTLYSFSGAQADGQSPNSGVLLASDGLLYGTTSLGGANDRGVFYRLAPNGTETVLYSFGASFATGLSPSSQVTEGKDGNFYGFCGGGAFNSNMIFKITPAGDESTFYSFPASSGAFINQPVSDLLQGADGNFYGTYSNDGNQQSTGVVYRITPTGTESLVYSFGVNQATGIIPGGALLAKDGKMYGNVRGGKYNTDAIFRLNL